ncbi:alpha-D-ribose 1-methylphosphonate 5-triphosphate diphosphatase [Falsihalocynthiibacter sp. SS001]|uniref:alpha-D-ribose 1-methylphosphonate 5-triphosphate diphosphatase n=1 Tax=Falsihalocynthiibacter sp. SS001 TaxID=3349698 RepID=UPI0036D3FED2
MTSPIILANAQVVLANEVVAGALVINSGKIEEVMTGQSVPNGAIDCEGDYVCAGLIELHTDNLERHISPRPAVDWPHEAAIVAHDAELAGVGITTVFDAVRVGSIISDSSHKTGRYARELASEVLRMRDAGALRISHHLHLRAEICSETLPQELDEFGAGDRVGIVSLMDHTPGQRQFRDMAKFEHYVCSKRGLRPDEFAAHVEHLYSLQEKHGQAHEAAAVAAAKRFGATIASHDDTTCEQVRVSADHGVQLAEFPTTVEAARTCHDVGVSVIMGAPNLVRGGSHSGNVAARELADLDLLDILSSDYVPAALLLAAVQLGELWGDMSRGMATVTAAPAARTGLEDRGTIAAGKRADICRFKMLSGIPIVRGVWSEGRQVS